MSNWKSITYRRNTIERQLKRALTKAAEEPALVQVVVRINDKDEAANVRFLLRTLTAYRTDLGLDIAINARTYHNGQRVLDIALEDYVSRNGWRREYVGLKAWAAEELRLANLEVS